MADTMNKVAHKDSSKTKKDKEKAEEKKSAKNALGMRRRTLKETAQIDKSGGSNRKEFSLHGETNTEVKGKINADMKRKRQSSNSHGKQENEVKTKKDKRMSVPIKKKEAVSATAYANILVIDTYSQQRHPANSRDRAKDPKKQRSYISHR